jgi:hypothetical protein
VIGPVSSQRLPLVQSTPYSEGPESEELISPRGHNLGRRDRCPEHSTTTIPVPRSRRQPAGRQPTAQFPARPLVAPLESHHGASYRPPFGHRLTSNSQRRRRVLPHQPEKQMPCRHCKHGLPVAARERRDEFNMRLVTPMAG